MKYILIVFVATFFVACSNTEVNPNGNNSSVKAKKMVKNESILKIEDLEKFPQNASSYLKNTIVEPLRVTQKNYEKNYFRVWNEVPSDTKETAMWSFRAYKAGESYGENLQLLQPKFFATMEKNANFNAYKSINKNALTLRHLNIRAFPTSQPVFHKPSQAGEGFPFDYMQNSTVSANKPIFISHYSKDKQWAYIFTSFTAGWVKTKDIVIVDKRYTDIWQKAQQIFILKDGEPIYDENGVFLFKSKIGMMLALVKESKNNYTVLTISTYKGLEPLYLKSKISKTIASKDIISFNKKNIISVMDEIAKSKYGWGGIYGQRDCSSTLRDFYAPFGLWLPRNSFQQAKVGEVIQLEHLSNAEKIKLIKDRAIPFKTFFHKQGHILLYIGIYDGEVMAFHNIWGIKTKKDGVEGRLVIGKAVFSTLKLGSEQKYYDKDAQILKNIKSMNIVSN